MLSLKWVRPEPHSTERIEILNGLLRGELAAVESYRGALLDEELRRQASAVVLKQIANEHRKFAKEFSLLIREDGGTPTHSGPWGVYAKAVTATAHLMGKIMLLNALKEGEELGLKFYEQTVEHRAMDKKARAFLRLHVIPATKGHIPLITRMLEAELWAGFMER
jgi:demethoxyubiquinone hydroxylase (CLK1/Coq7/Cat5 family)